MERVEQEHLGMKKVMAYMMSSFPGVMDFEMFVATKVLSCWCDVCVHFQENILFWYDHNSAQVGIGDAEMRVNPVPVHIHCT